MPWPNRLQLGSMNPVSMRDLDTLTSSRSSPIPCVLFSTMSAPPTVQLTPAQVELQHQNEKICCQLAKLLVDSWNLSHPLRCPGSPNRMAAATQARRAQLLLLRLPVERPTLASLPMTFSNPKQEEAVIDYWRSINAFQTSLEQSKGRPPFSFYDGPPFATGLPHCGHLNAGTIKDIVTRHAHATGHHVERKF
ncbi:unnamed protein product [Tilletia caries]|nr:unnamed protein product [Tilletia controversa]CAD6924253.1 unnamed protein product [Tilletia caries]CAD7065575.1 unnamed protein product [Tilletia caries]